MKKVISILIALVLTFALFCVPASAAGTGTLALSNAEGKQGDTVTINVNLNSNPGLTTMRFTVSWGEGLELASVSNAGLLSGWTTPAPTISSPYTLRWADSLSTTNSTKTGKIATLTFKIKDNATVGNKTVTLTFIESWDANGGKNTFGNATATIKVNCKTHTYGTYTKKDNTNHTRTCSVCGNVETKAHTWNGGSVTKPADCKEAGNTHYTCTANGCGATKDVPISKTNNHTYGSWSQTSAPKCTTVGKEQRTCSTCRKVETRDIKATGHSMGGWTQTKAPTCEGKGEQTRTCSKCSHKETKAVNALGHKFSNPTVTKAPTCTQTGTETGKCTVCKKETTNTIKALGHKFGEWTVKAAATCTEKGIEEHKCSVCEATENRDIEALGHDFEDPKTIKEPTISETGLKQGKCKICGQITEEVIPCTAKDETTGVVIETDKGVFQEGTELKVEEIKKENKENKEKHKEIKKALKEVSEKFVAYDITTVLNGAKVQPNGKIKVTFKIPEGFSNILKVFFIGDDGTTQEQTSKVNEDGTITAELTHFSTYVICDVNEDSVIGANGNAQSNTLLIIIPIAAVVIIGGLVIVIVAAKKKKAKIED